MWRTLTYGAGVLALAASAVLARARLPEERAFADFQTTAIPTRIASLSPSTTELCAAVGLTDHLVARSSFCDWPPGIERVPAVGALIDPDLERLVGLRPDLVLIPGRSQLLQDTLEGIGLRALSLPDSSLEDVYNSLWLLGRATGRDVAARRKTEAIRRELAMLARPAKPQLGKRVLLVVSPSRVPPVDPWVALPGSYLNELLQLAGHRNAIQNSGSGWSAVSLETVLQADPDVILEFWPDAKAGNAETTQQAWAAVGPMKAVRNGQIHVLIGQNHYTPGPRVAETLRTLVVVLGP